MVRTILANRKHERYLEKCSENLEFSFGLVIGQPTEQNKDFIVHLARNSEQDFDEEQGSGKSEELSSRKQGLPQSPLDIDSQGLANQVISATKMLPGCFYILGLFVASKRSVFDSESDLSAMKNHLQELIKLLNEHSSLCGTSPTMPTNKLLLSYNTTTKYTQCKTFEPKEEGGGFFMPVDWKYLDKHTDWHKFETTYEVDEVFPLIVDEDNKVNIEDNLYMCLNLINSYIKHTEIFFLNEDVEDGQMLETYLKRNYSELGSVDAITASIFQSSFVTDPSSIQIKKFQGSIKFKGIISCRIWSHPKNTFKEIKQFIHHDILRSIAARTQTYCDGLADPTIGDNDDYYISEPPRRVYFDVPDSNGLQFSEYIFHGELPIVAAAQAKEMMDLTLDTDKIHADMERDMDENAFAIHHRGTIIPDSNEQREIGRNMYIIGIVVAILVLLASIFLHFILKK